MYKETNKRQIKALERIMFDKYEFNDLLTSQLHFISIQNEQLKSMEPDKHVIHINNYKPNLQAFFMQ